MGIAAVTEELAARNELEKLFRLDASESEPEDDSEDGGDDQDEEGEGGESDGAGDEGDGGGGVRPEGMPHD